MEVFVSVLLIKVIGMAKRKNTEVWVRPVGGCYGFNTHCNTLKEAMQTYPTIAKRSWIADWWRNPIG